MVVQARARAPRRRAFGISPRLGAGYAGAAEVGIWQVGLTLSYTLIPQVALELRGDVLMPFEDDGSASAVNSGWVSLDLRWCFLRGSRFRPYFIAGVAVAFVPAGGGGYVTAAGGGLLGLGLEVLLRRWIGLSLEAAVAIAGRESDLLEVGLGVNLGVTVYL